METGMIDRIAGFLTLMWEDAGRPDAVLIYRPEEDTVKVLERRDFLADMEANGKIVPDRLREPASGLDAPKAFWVMVVDDRHGRGTYFRVADLGEPPALVC